ncbi:unnamed protein product [Notodromas monacha]|uniref:Uncharacterized protein n=1 Tax=Notodromas monacha TaxID=399045 RepID=A0A7R9BMC1_9CRUS|nr:unnamed protein product [Notodromas monacha]CAG0916784.1 unnamed protein product [Notodromas monacha]
MGITLYYLPHSPPCRAVHLLAKELGLEIEIKTVNLLENEHLNPEFIAINPMHTVPALDDNGFVIWESHAIMQYLANKYGKEDDGWYPKDPEKRAIVDNRMFFDDGTLFSAMRGYVYPVFRQEVEHFSSSLRTKMKEALGWLDGFIEKSGGWVAGPNKTIADICLVGTMSNIEKMPGIHDFEVSTYKHIEEWMTRCKAELKDYDETMEQGAYKWLEVFKKIAEGKEIK